jgi:23S rRNA (uracil1939-C5)-methyltransferase
LLKTRYIHKGLGLKSPSLTVHSRLYSGRSYSRGPLNKREKSRTISNKKPEGSWKIVLHKLDNNQRASAVIAKPSTNTTVIDELQCRHFSVCSGCTVNSEFSSSPVMKSARDFFSSLNVDFPIHIANFSGWRTHAKLAVQPMSKWGGLKFGLFRANSHEVENIPYCKAHHVTINDAVSALLDAAIASDVKSYRPPESWEGRGRRFLDDRTSKVSHSRIGQHERGLGELRHIKLTLERSTNKVQLVLVWNAVSYKDMIVKSPSFVRLLKILRKQPIWHSITLNFHTNPNTNVIVNRDESAWKLVWGLPTVKEKIGAATFYFSPAVFRQANLDAFEHLIIPKIRSMVPLNSVVSELYSGVGIIGLNLADKATKVFCSDSNPFIGKFFDKAVLSLPKVGVSMSRLRIDK